MHRDGDLAAPISSGSFKTDGMLVIPCSIKSASAIAYGFNANLLARAADVCLKEKRRLVLVVRETPLHLGHLRTLTQLAELGAVILPPVPGWYARPKRSTTSSRTPSAKRSTSSGSTRSCSRAGPAPDADGRDQSA